MVFFKILALFALAARSQGCYVEVSTSEARNVITPTCSLNCQNSGNAQTTLNQGFRTEYRDEALKTRGLRVCMKVGENNVVDQCVVEVDSAAAADADPCVPAVQKEVPSAYTKVGDKWMVASNEVGNQDAGKAFCASNGGVMARPSSAAETQAIAAFMNGDHAYIGVNDIDSEGSYYYNDASVNSAEPVSWTNWNNATYGGNEPNNHGDEDCVVLRSNKEYRWNDVACWKTFKALCEWSPNGPVTAGMSG